MESAYILQNLEQIAVFNTWKLYDKHFLSKNKKNLLSRKIQKRK